MINGWHVLAAVLACWRLTELITIDRISESFRRRFPHYLWGCPRCVSVWCGVLVTCAMLYLPWLNWPIALSHIVIVLFDWRGARSRWYRSAQPISGGSDLWGGVLDPSRAIDWTTAGVAGGIPSAAWTQCGSQINAYSGPAATINTVINNCASSQPNSVVLLGSGTFNLSSNLIMKSNIALRGAGPNSTKIIFSGSADSCSQGGTQTVSFCGLPFTADNGVGVDWTAGYAKGATVITVANTAGFVAGTSVLFLDQIDDSADPGTAEVFVSGDNPAFQTDTPTGGRGSGATQRTQQEFKLVTAVNGNNLTITPPLYASNWRSSQAPQAVRVTNPITNSGLEDVSLDHTNSGHNVGVSMFNAYNCWLRNIRSVNNGSSDPCAPAGRAHVRPYWSARITIRDSYFYGTRSSDFCNPGVNQFIDQSQRYGVEPYVAGDMLVENNIFQHILAPLLPQNGHGNVFGYNYSIDHSYVAGQTFHFGGIEPHSGGTMFLLFEGNQSNGFVQDNVHGTQNLATYFRNQFIGRDSAQFTDSTNPAIIRRYNRFMNLIGNVLGEAGYHIVYAVTSSNAANCSKAIYALDALGVCGTVSAADALVSSTLYRWGNYDTVTNGTRFVGGEVPTALPKYAQGVPGSQSLPASFYLFSLPSTWWGTPYGNPQWPAVGPDVVGGDVTAGTGAASTLGGHAYKIPARLCYESLVDDPAYPVGTVQVFNANSCYTGSATPVAPRSLIFIG